MRQPHSVVFRSAPTRCIPSESFAFRLNAGRSTESLAKGLADLEKSAGILSTPQAPKELSVIKTIDPDAHTLEEELPERPEDVDVQGSKASSGLFDDPTLIPDECLPKLAIVGRPNVGKSALFNRFSRTSTAIVFDKPGVTRDRLYTRAFWGNKEFTMIDTGGLPDSNAVCGTGRNDHDLMEREKEIPVGVEFQVAMGVEEADGVILVVDGVTGLTGSDQEIVSWLRREHSGKPVALAVNKCENYALADQMAASFWELGMEPIPVSALSGLGTGELLDAIIPKLPPPRPREAVVESETMTTVALLGRPNTGKSSLLNALVGEDRSIVSSVPGTTRDAIDAEFTLKDGRKIKIVDTAGVRRRMAVYGSKDRVESMMVEHSIRAMRQANVVVLMIDANEGVTQQDFKLSLIASQEGCAVVVVANKFDLLEDPTTKKEVEEIIRDQLREVRWAEVVVTSITEEKPVKKVTRAILSADKSHCHRTTTATLNMVIRDAINWRPPPAHKGRKARIYYGTQASTRPPTFVLFVNEPKLFTDDYKRYLKKQLRENIGCGGTPIHLVLRGKPSTVLSES